VTARRAKRGNGGLGEVIVLLGGSSPSPPFSRFARRAVTGKAPSLPCKSYQLDALRSLEDIRGKNDLAANLRNSTSRVCSMNGSSTSDSAPSEARKRGSGGGSPRKHDDLPQTPRFLASLGTLSPVKLHHCLVRATNWMPCVHWKTYEGKTTWPQTYVIRLVEYAP
jgi:hypothetical protein